jgi:hypothetical protein
MKRRTPGRSTGHLEAVPDRNAILQELERVVASQHFCNSKRYPALLKYIVENTLAGRSDLLKERTLGVEVFDRSPTYDTNTDTVVRYTAGEVRKRLLLHYAEEGRNSGVQISLPVGSYIPEFLQANDEPEESEIEADVAGDLVPVAEPTTGTNGGAPGSVPHSASASLVHSSPGASQVQAQDGPALRRRLPVSKKALSSAAAGIMMAVLVFSLLRKQSSVQPESDLAAFWAPVLHEQRTAVMCTGGVVFAKNNFSGVHTASRDIDYPFISLQSASAIAGISGLVERSGAATQLVPAASTSLTVLREHSVILIGGFNNQWTLLLLDPLRFHFSPDSADSPDPLESIVDRKQPEHRLTRDQSLPYSSADDYALVARFRDATIGGWVVAVAGIGRNGTEAAAQVVTSPHYMQLLRRMIGKDFANQNIEAVLKVKVVDGRTGAPSILAAHSW